jgi:HSP20 family protein
MNIVRWSPFREIEALQENVNRLFQEQAAGSSQLAPSMRAWAPAVDVIEDEEKILIKAELPGLRKEDIDIELTGDTLTIKGERKSESEEKKENFVRVERAYGQFVRSFTIGVPVKAGEIAANYKDGILEVMIPKAEEVKPKKVAVHVD